MDSLDPDFLLLSSQPQIIKLWLVEKESAVPSRATATGPANANASEVVELVLIASLPKALVVQ